MGSWRPESGRGELAKKVDGARRCADLLAALARTANVRLALKETGISAYWAYRRRKTDGDFDARWRTAVRAGRRELAKAAAARARDVRAARPAAGLTPVGSLGKGTLRLERVKPCSFTDDKRARFLDALRATCNVRAAAAAAGVSARGAYRLYHEDASFREDWNAALAEGRVHLEMAMMGAARGLFDGASQQPAGSESGSVRITGMDAAVALQLLRLHGPRADGRPRGRWVKPADAEATRREILAKVAAVRAARATGTGVGPGDARLVRGGAGRAGGGGGGGGRAFPV